MVRGIRGVEGVKEGEEGKGEVTPFHSLPTPASLMSKLSSDSSRLTRALREIRKKGGSRWQSLRVGSYKKKVVYRLCVNDFGRRKWVSLSKTMHLAASDNRSLPIIFR